MIRNIILSLIEIGQGVIGLLTLGYCMPQWDISFLMEWELKKMKRKC